MMETDGRQYQAINRAALRECEARLESRDREIERLRAELETTLRALRYLHNFPNAPAAHANAAKIIPSDAEFDRMARANDSAAPTPEGEQQSRGIDNLLDEMAADIDSMSDEEIRAESSPGDAEEMRRVIESATAPHTPEQAQGDTLAAMKRLEWPGDYEGREADIRTVLQALTASGVPDGYKLVPVEPTEEMLAAVDEAQMEHSANSLGADLPFEQAWAEALAAAPTDGRE